MEAEEPLEPQDAAAPSPIESAPARHRGGTDRDDFESRRAARKRRDDALSRRLALWLVLPLALLLTGLVLVFFVLFESSTVVGPSMMPALRNQDYVLATKGLPDPQRGDIVIVDAVNPKTHLREEWVKRIVAVGGDVVDVRGDIILVNGRPEQFRHVITTSGATTPIRQLTVEPGRVFLAGDNRGLSEDSRYPEVGTFAASAIKGRVVFIYAPIWRMGPVPAPAR